MIEDLRDRLERLGLSQYLDAFVAEGFDSWETVVDITESDLTALNVKLGHRRKLQRAIVESTGRSIAPLVPDPRKGTIADESYRSDDSAAESRSSGKRTGDPSSHAGTTTKRKYRRHPKPDDNAPERPPSAYVIFSNHVRETLKGQNHSFTEIAKIVGERWQVLSPSDRESCERQANFAKEKYGVALAEYKKTAEYGSYQEYLAEFKAKHGTARPDSKKSRSEADSNSVAAKGSAETVRPPQIPPHSGGSGEAIAHRPARSDISSSSGTYHAVAGPKATSTPTYTFWGMSSPATRDQYSPMSVSPISASLKREPSYELYQRTGMSAHEHGSYERPRIESQSGSSGSLPPQAHYRPQVGGASSDHYSHSGSPSLPSPPIPAHQQFGTPLQSTPAQNIPDMRSRRVPTSRDPPQLPSLTHEETTYSSDGGIYAPSNYPYQRPPIFSLDVPQGSKERILPHPIPSGVGLSPPIGGSSRVPTTEFGRSTPGISPGLPAPPNTGGWPALLAVAAREGEEVKREREKSVASDLEKRVERPTDKPP